MNPLRNRLFWQFVSHKVSRLAVPWCLLGVISKPHGAGKLGATAEGGAC